jgi:hypothetical protein
MSQTSTAAILAISPAGGAGLGAGPGINFVLRGATIHFKVFFQDILGGNGTALADDVLRECEADYTTLSNLFGGMTPGPFNVNIQFNVMPPLGGALHFGCRATDLYCSANSGSPANPAGPPLVGSPSINQLVVAEESEVFMAAQNRGWDCAGSNGEALSRLLAEAITGLAVVTAPTWIDSANRPDWVTVNDPTGGTGVPSGEISTGCDILFFNYLRFQLGFPLDAIIAAGGATMAQTYTRLTGLQDAFAPFALAVQQVFPIGTPSGVFSNNIFPIPNWVKPAYAFGPTPLITPRRPLAVGASEHWVVDLLPTGGPVVPLVAAMPAPFTTPGQLEVTNLGIKIEEVRTIPSNAAGFFSRFGVSQSYRLEFDVTNLGGTAVGYIVAIKYA